MPNRHIPPSGPSAAALIVVGRDCGSHEMAEGRGFVGPAGKLIWSSHHDGAADKVGITRHECLVTNVVNTRPTHNEWEAHEWSDVERGCDALWALLMEPRRLIVALGQHAALACMGEVPATLDDDVSVQFKEQFGDTITNVRGYVYEGIYGPVLVMVHPAAIIRAWHPWWATFCWDFEKAARLLRNPYQPRETRWELVGGGGVATTAAVADV